MKKIAFEKLENNELFGSFQVNKLSSLATANVKGGETNTELCKTTESTFDKDRDELESLADPRC